MERTVSFSASFSGARYAPASAGGERVEVTVAPVALAATASSPLSFEQLVALHYDLAWRTLRRLGVEESGVDDAVQKVFLTLHEKRARIETGRERAFLIGVCSGIAANTRRAQRRARARGGELRDDLPSPGRGQDVALDQQRARGLLDAALEALEPDLRLVFVLHELERMTGPEIAECVGAPLGTVASRLRRARALITERLAEIRQRFGGEP